MKISGRVKLTSLCIAAALCATTASANLGGSLSSIEKDRRVLRGYMATFDQDRYSVHEIQHNGQTVREYSLPNGKVFAVSWRGQTTPDLSLLLGDYYAEYKDAAPKSKARRGRGAQVMRSRNLIVEKSGHMRDLRGKAYLPSLLPEGVRPEDLI